MALCQNVRRSVSYIRDRTWRRHFASLRKIEMVAVLCTNGPPPCHFPTFCPQGVADPQKGRRHVPTQATPACKIWRESARGLLRNRWPNKQTNIQISQGGGQKVETYSRKFPFESNLESNRRIVVYSFSDDDAQENRNGRLQNTKLVLRHSLFGPPCRTPCAMGPYTCNRCIKHFSVCCLYASIYNGCRDIGT